MAYNGECIYPAVKRKTRRVAKILVHDVFFMHNIGFHHHHQQSILKNVVIFVWDHNFFRPLQGGARRPSCCYNVWCHGIGYATHTTLIKRDDLNDIDRLYTRADVVQAIGVTDTVVKKKILTSNDNSHNVPQLAPWHFEPKYRIYDEDTGTWRMIRYSLADQFVSSITGKMWSGIPPPDYNPKRFVQEEMHGGKCILTKNHFNLRFLSSSTNTMNSSDGGAFVGSSNGDVRSPFPGWVAEYIKAEGIVSVINTLDTLDIPPSMSPFSLADVNLAWHELSRPEETESLKRSRAWLSRQPRGNTVDMDNDPRSQQLQELNKKCRAVLQKNEKLEQLTDKCRWLLQRNETLEREKQVLEQRNRDFVLQLQQQQKATNQPQPQPQLNITQV